MPVGRARSPKWRTVCGSRSATSYSLLACVLKHWLSVGGRRHQYVVTSCLGERAFARAVASIAELSCGKGGFQASFTLYVLS